MTTGEPLYVHYGCGLCAPRGWLEFDSYPSLWLSRLAMLGQAYRCAIPRFPASVRYGDIVRGLPVTGGSCSGVYASHVLEHLGRAERARSPVSRLREAIGSSNHWWMWGHKSLVAECERAGFDRVHRCAFGDTDDPAFAAVEDLGRFDDAVAIEARRPGGRP